MDQRRPDCSSGGLPCPSFSNLRHQSGNSPATQDPDSHPSFCTVMSEFFDYLRSRRPRSWWIEEVERFNAMNKKTGKTYLQEFVEQCARLQYFVRVIKLNHSTWIGVGRGRLFVLGVGADCGGRKAVEWIVEVITASTAYRELAPPTAVWSLIDPEADDEQARYAKSQDCVPSALPFSKHV